MPNVTPVQSDFSVGEVAPDLQMRSTLDAQRRGVKTMTNFVADSRGPAIRRKGFRFLGKVGEAAPPVDYATQAFITQLGAAAQSRTSKSDDAYNNFEDPFVADTDLRNASFISINRNNGEMATASNLLVAYSSDIDNWDTVNAGTGSRNLQQVIWDEFGQRWLAVNSHPANGSAFGIIIRQSEDLLNWTTLYEDPADTRPGPFGIAVDGVGNMVMCGVDPTNDSFVMYSLNNGQSWTDVNITSLYDTSGGCGGVRYVNGFWFILGTTMSLLKSSFPEGPYVGVMNGPLFDTTRDIVYGEGIYVCMRENDDGGNQNIVYSTDAVTWINATYTGGATSPSSPAARSVVFDPDFRWCAVGNNQILLSNDGITWAPAPQWTEFTGMSGVYLWEYPDV